MTNPIRESSEYKEQVRAATQAAIAQWKRDAAEADALGIGYGPDPDLSECPVHGEYLDDEGGCCLCYEETGDDFAYRKVTCG
jgi:hypothetical protein